MGAVLGLSAVYYVTFRLLEAMAPTLSGFDLGLSSGLLAVVAWLILVRALTGRPPQV